MAVIATIGNKEDFLVQLNGDYNVPFDEVNVTIAGAVPAGTLLASAAAVSAGADTVVFGILAEDKPAGSKWVRVMTRGNPTTVNAQALSTLTATLIAGLAAKNIIVVNN
jgi:hypothetical protein